jgi:hypothetical protein
LHRTYEPGGQIMKCATILSLAILLTGTCAFSQETVMRPEAKLALATPPLHLDRTNCPIGLEVKHATGLPTAISAEGPTINGKALPYGQVRLSVQNLGIHLILTNLSPQSIVSAQVVVHGFSSKWRYVPLSGADPDLATTVDVALDVKGNGQASTAVDVNEITYADGSTWRTSSPGACSASPDLFMPVNVER